MGGSSTPSPFEGVSLRAVVALVRAIQVSSLRTQQRIERVFSKSAEGFAAVLSFCRRLGIVRVSDGSLTVGAEVPGATGDAFSEYVLHRLFGGRNRYRSEVYRFLRRFRIKDGEVSYASPISRRWHERACRNFLMEIKLVVHRPDRGEYLLSSEHVSTYAAARDSSGNTSPAALQAAMRARSKVGLAAEVAVMRFEKSRVGPDLAGEVKHIGLTNVAAGYDIRSVTTGAGSQGMPRYIEVKAVSAESFSFYWSRNEVDLAEVLGQHYYLYLLPVDRRGNFDFAALKMIADPHVVVMGSPSDWTVEEGVRKCGLPLSGDRRGTYGR